MNTAAAISRAAMPDPHTVCGVQLRPYCIGHWLHLQRCEISFAVGGEHTVDDLLLATLICSKTYEDFAGSLQPEDITRELSAWYYRLSGGFRGVWRRRFKFLAYWICNNAKCLKRFRTRFAVSTDEVMGFNVQTECKAFETYIAEHGGSPSIVNDWARPTTASKQGKDTEPLRAPELMVLRDALTVEQGFSETEALNMPLPKARWERAIYCERKGWVRIVSDAELKELRSEKERADAFSLAVKRGEVKP